MILFFVLLGIFLPFAAANAAWYTVILEGIGSAIINSVLSFVALIASFFGQIGTILLTWATSSTLTPLTYGPKNNTIVSTGLAVTQSLANMFLVLILVFIGIATMLRLAGYETKKLLRDFIIIALIVNFAPVILGIAIDASNIIMNYFLSKVGAYTGLSKVLGSSSTVGEGVTSFFTFEKSQQLVVSIIMNICVFFIFTAFALVFLVRRIILWILIILSPIAFVFSILPIARIKKYYEQWLTNFVDWCVLGITLSFFLYMADVAAGRVGDFKEPGLLGGILVYIVPIIFYIMALMMGISVGGIGSGFLSALRGKTAAGMKGTPSIARRWGKWGITKAREAMPEKTRKWFEGLATKPRYGEGETGVGGWLKRTITAPYYHARRTTGKTLGTGIVEDQKETVKKVQEKVKGKTPETIASEFNKATIDADRIGILNQAIEQKDFDDVKKAANIKDEEIRRLIKQAKKWDSHKTLERANPHLSSDVNPLVEPTNPAAVNDPGNINIAVSVSSMKPMDYGRLSEGAIDRTNIRGRVAVSEMVKKMTREQFQKAFENLGISFLNAVEDDLDAWVPAGWAANRDEALENANPKLHEFLTSSLGAGLISL